MPRTLIVTATVLLAALVGSTVNAAPLLAIDQTDFDFGFAPQNSKVCRIFQLRNDGDDKMLNARVIYSQILLDPRASERLRAALRPQLKAGCAVLPESDEEARVAQRWPMSCFGPALEFFGLTFRF